jgi:type IV fimbrial biogenesis protein FimT
MRGAVTGCRPARLHGPAGWSLVELLVALALLASLSLLAGPMYSNVIAERQLLDRARLLADTLNAARSEAIKHGNRVNVCKSRDGRTCASSGSWDMGWITFTDDDRSADVGSDEVVLRADGPARDGVTISANRPVASYVSYTSLGYARTVNGALQMGTFTVCKSGQYALDVVLANGGRVRIDKSKVRCP